MSKVNSADVKKISDTMKVLMVRGPSTVHVKGRCRLLGMDVSNRIVQVRAGKAMPFELSQECILIHDGASWDVRQSDAGTTMWTSMVERVLSMPRRHLVVMIVGASDTGKSTLATYMANMAVSRGIQPCVLDGDIGQGDLAPPTAVGAALVPEQVTDLRDVDVGYFEFIGSITPFGSERLIVNKMKSLLARTRRLSQLHIINTDGYVSDDGSAYKMMLARTLLPDVIVNLGADKGLSMLGRGRWTFVDVRSSSQATKTWSDRKGRRMDQFIRHVGEGDTSVRIDEVKLVYRTRGLSVVAARRIFLPSLEGMFVGLGLHGIVIGFGIIETLDKEIKIRTGVGRFDTVYLSNIALKDGQEYRLSD